MDRDQGPLVSEYSGDHMNHTSGTPAQNAVFPLGKNRERCESGLLDAELCRGGECRRVIRTTENSVDPWHVDHRLFGGYSGRRKHVDGFPGRTTSSHPETNGAELRPTSLARIRVYSSSWTRVNGSRAMVLELHCGRQIVKAQVQRYRRGAKSDVLDTRCICASRVRRWSRSAERSWPLG